MAPRIVGPGELSLGEAIRHYNLAAQTLGRKTDYFAVGDTYTGTERLVGMHEAIAPRKDVFRIAQQQEGVTVTSADNGVGRWQTRAYMQSVPLERDGQRDLLPLYSSKTMH